MFIDTASAVDMSFWGFRTFEGVDFYIEPETDLPEICPFKKPEPLKLPCPHRGLCPETYKKWKQISFTVGEPEPEKIFTNGLKIREDLTFIHAGYMPSKGYVDKLLRLTNAVPLIIYGLKTSHDFEMIFDLARSSIIRPVHIYGAGNIPVPPDFRKETR